MGRSSQFWALVLLVAAAVAVTMVAADEAAPTISEKLESTKEMSKDHLESATEMTKVQGAKLKEAIRTWQDWAMMHAGKWSGKGKETADGATGSAKTYIAKGVETLHTSTAQTQESIAGVFSKWSNWAKEKAGKYGPAKQTITNPASDAVSYINKHTPGSSEDEL